jgi:protein TonB
LENLVLWRIVCLVLSVLGVHLALLGWLQPGSDRLAAVAPPLRFNLTPGAPPTRTSKDPGQLPTPSATPPKAFTNKVQERTPVAVQTQAKAVTPKRTEASVLTTSTLTSTGLDELTGKARDTSAVHSAHVGTPTPALTTPAVSTTPATTVLPPSNADYLNNPAPSYPAISRRLGEQGKVVIRVLIGKDGMPQQGDIHQSSGYARLDQAALRAVMGWRYVPGQRDGMAQDMWFNVPINFALN